MRYVPIAFVMCLFLALSVQAAETVRPWTSQKGAILRATLVGFDGETAYLTKETEPDKIVPIAYVALSYEDQDYIDRRRATLPGAPASTAGALDTVVRDWTSVDGKVVTARLINVDNDFAVLEREGRVYRVPIFNLSALDQAYIQGKLASGVDMAAAPPPTTSVNPSRAWRFKDGSFEAMTLIGFRAVDQSLKFNREGRPYYVAFGDLIPGDQVLAYRWLEGQGVDVSKLQPEGDMTASEPEPTAAAGRIPGMPVLPPIPVRTEWTRASDGQTSKATLKQVNGYFVVLESSGREITLPIYLLAVADQEYLATYWGYTGPIGNVRPQPTDAMEVDLVDDWGVSPGEMVDVTDLSPEQLTQMFPAPVAAAQNKAPTTSPTATLGDPGQAADTATASADDELVTLYGDESALDDEDVEITKISFVHIAMIGIAVLSSLASYAMCVWIAIIARRDGLLWVLICLLTGVTGSYIYVKKEPAATKIPAVLMTVCLVVAFAMIFGIRFV